MPDNRIPCPFCQEPILPKAKKCRFCMEDLEEYLDNRWSGSGSNEAGISPLSSPPLNRKWTDTPRETSSAVSVFAHREDQQMSYANSIGSQSTGIQMMYWGALISEVLSFIPGVLLVGIVVWITLLIYSVIAKSESQSAARSHFTNFQTVFWVNLVVSLIVLVFVVVTLGIALIPALILGVPFEIWLFYRLIKGLIRVSNGQAYS